MSTDKYYEEGNKEPFVDVSYDEDFYVAVNVRLRNGRQIQVVIDNEDDSVDLKEQVRIYRDIDFYDINAEPETIKL